MGGDDLGDDLLWSEPVVASPSLENDIIDDHDVDGSKNMHKRPRPEDGTVKSIQSQKKKKEKTTSSSSPANTIVEASRGIDCQDTTQQAAFLTAAIRHYTLLENPNSSTIHDKPFHFLPSNLVKQSTNKNCDESLLDRIRGVVSVNKMKKWKHVGSPCVLVICISARRAVAVLKELAPLKVRAAKLFPKNGSVTEQRQQLSHICPVAVGTPQRLQQLFEIDTGNSTSTMGTTKLSLEQTQLVVLDCELSHKQYTVFSLPDTAPHCVRLIREAVVPQLQQRNDCKVAFF